MDVAAQRALHKVWLPAAICSSVSRVLAVRRPDALFQTMPLITLRPAVPEDAALLRRWDEQPHVVASDPNDDWAWDLELNRHPDWREQLLAEVDGRPIGFVQIIDAAREESHYWGDVSQAVRAIDIWIGEAADLGKGYGTAMMQLALARCFADPRVTAVVVDPLASNTRAHRFYQRLGFEMVGRRTFGEDECIVHRIDRAVYLAQGRRGVK
jgi:aminoglycoside 6'-N-acetyltransferase